MPRYTITEPHPTVVKDHYTHAGRGGAGNYFRAPTTTPASGVPTPAAEPTIPTTTTTTATAPSSSSSSSSTRFYSGRGGAGNLHVAPRPPALSFEEEYRRQARAGAKPVSHVGRGGAGNVYARVDAIVPATERKTSDASSCASSDSSTSGRSGFLGRLSKTLSRNH